MICLIYINLDLNNQKVLMKVLLLITKSEIGGAQKFVFEIAQSLQSLEVDVEVAGGEGNYLPEELKKLGISFIFLNSLKRNFNVFSSIHFIYDLFRLLRKNKYDIIHLNSSNTLAGALALIFLKEKPKTVFTFHGLSFLDEKFEINSFYKLITKLSFKVLLKFVNSSVFVSHNNFDFAKKKKIVSAGEVILNGLDEKEMLFHNRTEARKYFSEMFRINLSDAFLIGSTGRLVYQKNYEFLINNFQKIKEQIPEAKILVIGDGSNMTKYRELIALNKCAGDFILAGAIENSFKYMKAFDVFTLPSRYEGLSISMIEALYAEIPVLASDIGSNREVIDSDERQMYELDNIEDYIDKLINIKNNNNPIIRKNLIRSSYFTRNRMANQYKDVYKKLTGLE